MKEAVRYLCAIVMSEYACAADAQRVSQDRNRHSRSDDDDGSPETVALHPAQDAALSIIIILRAREICEDYCERQQGHKRANAATGFYDLELFSLTRALRHQLNHVALSQDRNIKEPHCPDRTARGEELKREGNLIEDDCRDWKRKKEQYEGNK